MAADVKQALEMAAAGSRFDLLLSDLRLPDGNGWDLLRRLEEAGWRGGRCNRDPVERNLIERQLSNSRVLPLLLSFPSHRIAKSAMSFQPWKPI